MKTVCSQIRRQPIPGLPLHVALMQQQNTRPGLRRSKITGLQNCPIGCLQIHNFWDNLPKTK